MFDTDRWAEIWNTLSKNKLRTALTAFGVAWGIFMLIILIGAGNGLKNGIASAMSGFATNSIYIWGQRTSIPNNGFSEGRIMQFTNDDIKAIKDKVPGIDKLAPRLQLGGHRGGNNAVRGTKTGAFSINGDMPDIQYISLIDITEGRFINEKDIEDQRKIAVIGKKVVELLFEKDENPIGEYIKINGVFFKVAGIFKTNKKNDMAEQDESTIYIPFSTFQYAFNYVNRIGWLAVTAKSNIKGTVVENQIKQVLGKRHDVHPDDLRAFGSFNLEEQFEKMTGFLTGISFLIWFVGVFTLLAGVIGVSNIMLITIKERTKEIGIRRAIGAKPSNIVTQIILESVVMTVLAGYLGLVAGIWSLEGLNLMVDEMAFKNPTIEISTAFTGLLILIIGGLIAGLIPANRALRIKPVDALRSI